MEEDKRNEGIMDDWRADVVYFISGPLFLVYPPFPPPHFHIAKEPAFLPINSTGRGNPDVKFIRDNWLTPTSPL